MARGPDGEPRRWPRAVYDDGEEPDYRFSLANERTYLAWIRTSLAAIAAGVALDVVDLSMPAALQQVLATVLVVLGLFSAVTAWLRWAAAERAMRHGTPLPSFGPAVLVSIVIAGAAVAVLVGIR